MEEEGTNGRREGGKKGRRIGKEEGDTQAREKSEGGGERKNERVSSSTCLRIKIPYSRKLSREKLLQILRICGYA